MISAFAGVTGLAFALGLRHGLDFDHLATIDGLTRAQSTNHERRAANCGLWFSSGHGFAIILMAVFMALFGQHIASVAWLTRSGSGVAVCALLALGVLNLWSAWRPRRGAEIPAITLKQWIAERYLHRLNSSAGRPFAVFILGGLFAISFDAVGAAALFAATAAGLSAIWIAAVLGAAFTLGMVLVGGITGWCSAWLLRRSHDHGPAAPRISAAILGTSCVLTAAVLLIEPTVTQTAGFSEASSFVLSAGVCLLVPFSYAATWWFTHSRVKPDPFTVEQKIDA